MASFTGFSNRVEKQSNDLKQSTVIEDEVYFSDTGSELDSEKTAAEQPEQSEPSIGYDFEDQQTRAQLELIDDLKRLGVESYLDLPQLVVVGDQSTGKSSVLQAVTEVPFESGAGMCTRFPTEIVLKRTLPNEPTETKVRIIPDIKESPERRERLKAWRPDSFDTLATLDKATIEKIVEQADDVIFEKSPRTSRTNAKSMKILSTSTLRITRSGPKETNFAIVDIPGLVRGKDEDPNRRTAIALVEKYLKNPRSIIVAVIDMVDWERHDITHMLKSLPDVTNRVIGVINKCDLKFPKANDFIFDLLRNKKSQSERYLKEGWYGLRNRDASEKDISDEERDKKENELFSGPVWSAFDKTKLGRHSLKMALIRMRNRHIKRSIPELISEIQSKLDVCLEQIVQLGQPRTTNQAQFTIVNKIATTYSKIAGSAVDGHYEGISDSKQFARQRVLSDLKAFKDMMGISGGSKPFTTSVEDAELVESCKTEKEWADALFADPTYSWVRSAISKYRGKEDTGEVNLIVKSQLWREQISGWEAIAFRALDDVERTIEEVNASLFEKECPDRVLRIRLQSWLQDDFQRAIKDARNELRLLLEGETAGYLFSLQPMMATKRQQANEARIRAILDVQITKHPIAAHLQAGEVPLKVGTVPSNMIVSSILTSNPELVAVLKTHDLLAAYYDVAIYRFIDNVALQVVERHLLGPRGPLQLFTSDYVTERLYGEVNAAALNDLAGEDPDVAAKRAKLEAERASLEASKKRVQAFKLL